MARVGRKMFRPSIVSLVGSGQGVAVREACRALAQPLAMMVVQPVSCRVERFSPKMVQPKKTTARGSK